MGTSIPGSNISASCLTTQRAGTLPRPGVTKDVLPGKSVKLFLLWKHGPASAAKDEVTFPASHLWAGENRADAKTFSSFCSVASAVLEQIKYHSSCSTTKNHLESKESFIYLHMQWKEDSELWRAAHTSVIPASNGERAAFLFSPTTCNFLLIVWVLFVFYFNEQSNVKTALDVLVFSSHDKIIWAPLVRLNELLSEASFHAPVGPLDCAGLEHTARALPGLCSHFVLLSPPGCFCEVLSPPGAKGTLRSAQYPSSFGYLIIWPLMYAQPIFRIYNVFSG